VPGEQTFGGATRPNGSFDESAPIGHDSKVCRGEPPVEPNTLPTSLRAWKPRTAPVLSIRWTVEQNQSRRRVERHLRPRDPRQEGTECIREPRPRRSRAGPSQCAAFGAEPSPPDPIAARTAAPAISPSTSPMESLTARSAATPAGFTENRRRRGALGSPAGLPLVRYRTPLDFTRDPESDDFGLLNRTIVGNASDFARRSISDEARTSRPAG
jgi:hypothetical protein